MRFAVYQAVQTKQAYPAQPSWHQPLTIHRYTALICYKSVSVSHAQRISAAYMPAARQLGLAKKLKIVTLLKSMSRVGKEGRAYPCCLVPRSYLH